jgi:hypothetical protein
VVHAVGHGGQHLAAEDGRHAHPHCQRLGERGGRGGHARRRAPQNPLAALRTGGCRSAPSHRGAVGEPVPLPRLPRAARL